MINVQLGTEQTQEIEVREERAAIPGIILKSEQCANAEVWRVEGEGWYCHRHSNALIL